jgi:PAS domain S-box-containing protein
MTSFALLSLLASVVTIALGTFVLFRNPRETPNRIFSLYCLIGSCWTFTEFVYRQAESFSRAAFWLRVSALGILVVPLELHFVLCIAERKRLLEKKSTYFLLYVPTLAFFILDITGVITSQPVKTSWGWGRVLPPGPLPDLYEAWFIVLSLLGLLVCWQYYRQQAEYNKKRQIFLVAMGVIAVLVLAVATESEGVFDYLGIESPELTSIGYIFESIFLAYAMWKYELFPLTPVTAAESIVAILADALLLVNPGGKIVAVNQAASELLGYEQNELIEQPIEMILAHEETAGFERTRLAQLLTASSIHDSEATFVTKDARMIPVSLSASVVKDQAGAEQGTVYVGRDLTKRKQAEEQIRASLREKNVLLREIHHRVKNNLQITASLLMLQSGFIENKQVLKTLGESQNRIQSMALVHETLYQSEDLAQVDFADYVQKLTKHLFRSYDADPGTITLQVNADSVLLNIDAVVHCGLIINELLSNALKYAFPDGQTGQIRIDLHPGDDEQLLLVVSDNGVGLPAKVQFRQAESLGLQLVEMLAEQLEGTVELDRSGGTTFRIAFDPFPAA